MQLVTGTEAVVREVAVSGVPCKRFKWMLIVFAHPVHAIPIEVNGSVVVVGRFREPVLAVVSLSPFAVQTFALQCEITLRQYSSFSAVEVESRPELAAMPDQEMSGTGD